MLLLLPVPWLHKQDSSLGLAWGLDTRLIVGGERLDPPGRWSWLTVGRPVLVGELLWQQVREVRDPDAPALANDLRYGSVSSRPEHAERVAAAVGLRRAGEAAALAVRVTVAGPSPAYPELPDRAVVTHLNGQAIDTRGDVRAALQATGPDGRLTFRTQAGNDYTVDGTGLPYRTVEMVDLAPGVRAAVGGEGPPYSWIRSMAMGSSHGLMVGLTTYAAVADEDLAAGRHVAGTGRLLGDGTVGSIGGLLAKATAARRQGADVLLVPASQVHQLDGFDPGHMRVLAVTTLDDAIQQLRLTAR